MFLALSGSDQCVSFTSLGLLKLISETLYLTFAQIMTKLQDISDSNSICLEYIVG